MSGERLGPNLLWTVDKPTNDQREPWTSAFETTERDEAIAFLIRELDRQVTTPRDWSRDYPRSGSVQLHVRTLRTDGGSA